MNRKYNLKLDLQFRCNNSIMKFNQFDNNTSDFFIRITNSGNLVDIEKAIVVLAIIKPSGKVASQFVEVENGLVYADLKPNMKDEIGTYTAQAMLILEDERVVTDSISYKVEEDKIFSLLNDTAGTSEEFTLLTDMLNRLSTIEISEEQRMINEAERILSEENRKIEEAKRVEAELIRQHEEADRTKYDATRESNENIRKQNESIRLANETNRIDEEVKRVEEEAKRVEAEQLRKDNYNFMTEDEDRRRSEANAHKEAEVLRVQAETNRVNEEAKRRTTEQGRVSAENTRVSNENTRKANETTRQTNETKRVEAETQRQNRYNSFIVDAEANANNFENYTNNAKIKEEERKSNELDRKSQEDRRVSNEVERISNENTRKANEAVREKNETSRQYVFENKVNEVDKKIVELNTTKDNFVSNINTKVDTKISEIDNVKDNFVSSVNTKVDSKISELDNAKSDMTNTVSKKVNEVENRFNALTSSQQQDAEVIDARVDFKGVAFNSLKERIDNTDKLLRDSTVSTVTTESDFTTVEATSNGYFEDVKLEGKTLVNMLKPMSYLLGIGGLIEEDYTLSKSRNYLKYVKINTNKTPTWVYVSCGKLPFDMLKPNTKYTIKLDKYVGVASVDFKCGDGTKRISDTGVIDVNGCAVVTTTSELVDAGQILYLNLKSSTVSEVEVSNVILLEGDHTQNPPSGYIEGLKSVGQDVEEVSVESVKGDGNLVEYIELNGVIVSSGKDYTDNKYVRTNYIIVEPNQTYYIKHPTNVLYKDYAVYFYDSNKSFLGYKGRVTIEFTTVTNTKFIRIDMKKADNTSNTQEDINNCDFVVSKCRVTEYVPRQSDKKRLLYYNEETQTWEKPILRQWDSIEKHSNGKYYYHQRSDCAFANGENGVANFNWEQNGYTCFYISTKCKNDSDIICNLFDKIAINQIGIKKGVVYDNTSALIFSIPTSELSNGTLEGVNSFLKNNNLYVVYQLAQEKVYECTNIDLITYNGETNFIVESGVLSPKTTLKVHSNISNVVSLLQKKVSLLENNITSYMITQNRLMLASRYNADTVSFKVDVATLRNSFEYDNDLYELILNNILVGKDNYNREYIENLTRFYWMDFVISDEMYSTLFEIIEEQHNPKIEEETPLI